MTSEIRYVTVVRRGQVGLFRTLREAFARDLVGGQLGSPRLGAARRPGSEETTPRDQAGQLMRKKVVYIGSLPHSGSTLLDIMLGQHPRFIGLGEIKHLLRGGVQRTIENRTLCSCGNVIHDCPFWGKALPSLVANKNLSVGEQYEMLLEAAQEVFGEGCTVVDSSKSLEMLRILYDTPNIDLKVLHLMRDVRAFAISQIEKTKKRKSRGLARGRGPAALFFIQWYVQNKKMKRFLSENRIPSFQVSYEELCLYPSHTMKKICNFLGEEPDPTMTSFGDPKSHVVRGNRMRRQTEKLQVLYDNRWFYRDEWVLPSVLFPFVMRFNRREVYANSSAAIWEQ